MGENARKGKGGAEIAERRKPPRSFSNSTAEMSIEIFAFDGGRTRARTLGPLIKSKRGEGDIGRHATRGPDITTCNWLCS